MSISVIDALEDSQLLRLFLGHDLTSWANWLVALRVVYGLKVQRAARELILKCTGRKLKKLPSSGFQTALFLVGRRSGKSRMAAIMGAYEAVFAGHEKKLAKSSCWPGA